MSRTPMSPSDLQRIYLLYIEYMQHSQPSNYEQNEDTLCRKPAKKKLTD